MAEATFSNRSMQRKIVRIAEMIREQFTPEKIILFGSYAYGSPNADSDVDLLVILPFKGKSTYKALEMVEKIKPSIPIDLIVKTPNQVRSRISQNDFFLSNILKRGKILYEATNS